MQRRVIKLLYVRPSNFIEIKHKECRTDKGFINNP